MRQRIGALALILMTTTALAACSAPQPQETPVRASTAEAPPAEPDAADLAAGDVVSADRATALNDAEGELRAYQLADGTFEIVDSAKPLSKKVAADIQSRVAAVPAATGPDDSEAVEVELGDLVFRANAETGRNVVVVTKLWVGDPVDYQVPRGDERWVHVGDPQHEAFEPWHYLPSIKSSDEYIAKLKAGVVGDPVYELFIH